MRLPLMPLIIFLIIGVGIDYYIYKLLNRYNNKIYCKTHLVSAILLNIMLVSIMFMPIRTGSDSLLRAVMWMAYTYLTFYFSKFIFIIFNLISDIPRFWGNKSFKWLSVTGGVISGIIFITMWWGALYNRFNIDVKYVDIEIENLPADFNGLTIAQISDLHVGTFAKDTTFVMELVEKVNSLNPDIIVFTGDIVNRRSSELKPFVYVLSKLNAPLGVYSILGNHDYGDYEDWPDEDSKAQNLISLKEMQKQMGWTLLNNDHVKIEKNGESIILAGVENVGDPPFHTYGDLSKAYPTPSDGKIKILLSHNPAHWINDISGNRGNNYALTLSGHTHAMQMEFWGLSPAVWRYPTWGGLYEDGYGHKLYVNIGAGTVGMPARIGATPEITLLRLKSK